jgi:hypothetical protein
MWILAFAVVHCVCAYYHGCVVRLFWVQELI